MKKRIRKTPGDTFDTLKRLTILLSFTLLAALLIIFSFSGCDTANENKTEPTISEANTPTEKPVYLTSTPKPTATPLPTVTPYPDGYKWGLYYEDGVVKKDGKEFRGLGFNYYDAFAKLIDSPDDEGYMYNFRMLAEYEIPFIRLNFGMYWPNQYELYDKNPDEFFARMDKVVKYAEGTGIGLICSLFWYDTGLTDYCDEPRNTGWGDENSKTREFMRRYTTDIVERYKHSPAIWAWEFGNEYNLGMDLPNAAQGRPIINKGLGTRTERTAEDDMKLEDIMNAMTEFAKLVRSLDPWRLITTGHADPRPGQWHQYMYKTWGPDDREQAVEAVMLLTPDPYDTISLHSYVADKRFDGIETIPEYIAAMADIANENDCALFLGEFGGDFTTFGFENTVDGIADMIDVMTEKKIDLGAIWNIWNPFDISKDSVNIQPNLKSHVILDMVKEYNISIWKELGIRGY